MGLTSKDKLYKENNYLTINDISKILDKGRCTLNTVISYLYIEPIRIKEGKLERCFFTQQQFNQIKDFYIQHPDYSTFLAKEMRIRKNGNGINGNGYTEERNIKTKKTIINRYGENWKQVLSVKTQKAIEKKYGDKNYRNVEKMKQTLYNNRDRFCREHELTLFRKEFKNKLPQSEEVLLEIFTRLNIHLVPYKAEVYIKNKDIEPLRRELKRLTIKVEYNKN